MPLFEYWCCRCEQRFEKLVSSSREETGCPACGNLSYKVFSTFRTNVSGREKSGGSSCSSCSGSSCSTC